MKLKFITVFLILLTTGCTTSMQLHSTGDGKFSRVDEKNYKIGEEHTVYVGERVLARKSYETIVQTGYVEASNRFTLTGGMGSVAVSETGEKGDKYKIVGSNEKGNFAVAIPGTHLTFGVTQAGQWDKTIASPSFWTSPVGSGSAYQLKPPQTIFLPVESSTPLSEAGYINHELIYTGIGNDGIHLLYREYTFENMARSAFTQELVYPTDSKSIRFKNYKLKIVKATSSEITYVVETE